MPTICTKCEEGGRLPRTQPQRAAVEGCYRTKTSRSQADAYSVTENVLYVHKSSSRRDAVVKSERVAARSSQAPVAVGRVRCRYHKRGLYFGIRPFTVGTCTTCLPSVTDAAHPWSPRHPHAPSTPPPPNTRATAFDARLLLRNELQGCLELCVRAVGAE